MLRIISISIIFIFAILIFSTSLYQDLKDEWVFRGRGMVRNKIYKNKSPFSYWSSIIIGLFSLFFLIISYIAILLNEN